LLPLIAALVAVFGWWNKRKIDLLAKYVPFMMGIIVVGYVLALGQYSPIFPFLYEHVPTFDLFQAPVRWHLWTVFGLSVLAGIGATWWQRGGRWTIRFTVACFGMALVTLALFPFIGIGNPALGVLVRALLFMSIFGVLAGLLTLRKPEVQSPRYGRWTMFVFVVIALDLGIASWGLNPTVPAAELYHQRQYEESPLRYYWGREIERAIRYDTFFRFDDYRVAVERWLELRNSQLPNLNLIDRFPLFNNFDPLLDGNYARYIDLLETNLLAREQLLAAAGVVQTFDRNGQYSLPDEQNSTPVFRVRYIYSICWHETETELVNGLLDPGWDFIRQAHILGDAGCEPVDTSAAAEGQLSTYWGDANAAEFDVSVRRDGWLILADTYYPGWIATVDGESTPIYRANLMFRAVQVSRGEHRVRFEYRPGWLVPGALLSGVSLIVLLLLFRLKNVTTPYNQSDGVKIGQIEG
jgi:hypothetical protein